MEPDAIQTGHDLGHLCLFFGAGEAQHLLFRQKLAAEWQRARALPAALPALVRTAPA
jgi:hypothetical protein